MKNEIEAMITDITTTTAEAEDYTGEDGLLYCGKCHTPKEAYFSKETAQWLGHDRHPTDCDCQRAAREKQQAAESRQKHLEKVANFFANFFISFSPLYYDYIRLMSGDIIAQTYRIINELSEFTQCSIFSNCFLCFLRLALLCSSR